MGDAAGGRERLRGTENRTLASRPLAALHVSDSEGEVLERWTRRQKSANALATRARIVIKSSQGQSNKEVAAQLGLSQPTVGKWRARYVARGLGGFLDEPLPGALQQLPRAGEAEQEEARVLRHEPEPLRHPVGAEGTVRARPAPRADARRARGRPRPRRRAGPRRARPGRAPRPPPRSRPRGPPRAPARSGAHAPARAAKARGRLPSAPGSGPPSGRRGAWGRSVRCSLHRPGAPLARPAGAHSPPSPATPQAPPYPRPPCRSPARASWSPRSPAARRS